MIEVNPLDILMKGTSPTSIIPLENMGTLVSKLPQTLQTNKAKPINFLVFQFQFEQELGT